MGGSGALTLCVNVQEGAKRKISASGGGERIDNPDARKNQQPRRQRELGVRKDVQKAELTPENRHDLRLH